MVNKFIIVTKEENDFKKDSSLYEVLGVDRDATRTQIRSAYKSLILKWHPDKKIGNSSEIFESVQKAYEILSNSERRKFYDFYNEEYYDMEEYFEKIINPNFIEELYKFSEFITILYENNLNKNLIGKNFTWIIEFYNPNCSSCRYKVPFVKSLASKVSKYKFQDKPKIKIGVINCLAANSICSRVQLQYMGQFVLFSPNQDSIDWDYELYKGPQEVNSIITAAENLTSAKFQTIKSFTDLSYYFEKNSQKGIIQHQSIRNIGIVEYYSPNCFYCRQLKQELKPIIREFKNTLSFGLIDCSKVPCNVPFFPYLKIIIQREGEKKLEEFNIDYQENGHPGTLMIKLIGMIFSQILRINKNQDTKKSDYEL